MVLEGKVSRQFYRAVFWLLVAGSGLAAMASVMHHLEPGGSHWLNLYLPPAVSACFAGLAVYLRVSRTGLAVAVHGAIVVAFIALAAPCWLFTLSAYTHSEQTLVASLPPVTSLVMLLLMIVVVLYPPRVAFIAVLVCWMLVSLPVLVYLLLTPQELWSPRGMDIVIALGPAQLFLLAIAPFYQGMRAELGRLRSNHDKLQRVAEHDALTQVYNRHAGERLLQAFADSKEPAGVVMLLDVDYFKRINDMHGHGVGDDVLRRLAGQLRLCLRDDSDIVRWGGEEFLVLVHGITLAEARSIADRLRSTVASCHFVEAEPITISVGVVAMRPGDSKQSLFERADIALYQAKQQGRNRVVVADTGD